MRKHLLMVLGVLAWTNCFGFTEEDRDDWRKACTAYRMISSPGLLRAWMSNFYTHNCGEAIENLKKGINLESIGAILKQGGISDLDWEILYSFLPYLDIDISKLKPRECAYLKGVDFSAKSKVIYFVTGDCLRETECVFARVILGLWYLGYCGEDFGVQIGSIIEESSFLDPNCLLEVQKAYNCLVGRLKYSEDYFRSRGLIGSGIACIDALEKVSLFKAPESAEIDSKRE